MKALSLNPATRIREEELYTSQPNWVPVDLNAIDSTLLTGLDLKGCVLNLVCGISTAGKDTLVSVVLRNDPSLSYLPRATSRPARAHEQEGVQYFFSVEHAIVWSEYAGHIYAFTRKALLELAAKKRVIQIQGLLYGLVLKTLLEPYGVRVHIMYILPQLHEHQLIGALRVVVTRLYTLHEDADNRIASIRRELFFVFSFYQELKKRGVVFIENPPSTAVPNPTAVATLLSTLK